MDAAPSGYAEPVIVYLVEFTDEPLGQVGGFFILAEATTLVELLAAEGVRVHINGVPVHRRSVDWEYDR